MTAWRRRQPRSAWHRLPLTVIAVLCTVAGFGAAAQDAAAQPPVTARRPIVVASKPFGESYLLAEMFAQLLERSGRTVQRRAGLGATEVAFSALRTGAIDVYPEYVGTGLVAILGDTVSAAMRADPRVAFAHVATHSLTRFGVHWLPPLGFQNGYAIAVRRETAVRYALRTLSDLATSPARLTAGFTSDFIGRGDGWPGLRTAYGLTLAGVRPLAPAVKYEAIAGRAVDIIDGYATDGLLAKHDLVTLEDDRRFFPPYEAAAITSARLMADDPGAVAVLTSLSGRLSEARMREWNRAIEVDGRPIPEVARQALAAALLGDGVTQAGAADTTPRVRLGFWRFMLERRAETMRLVGEHLRLVLLALGAAIAVAVPLGLWLVGRPGIAVVVMQGLGVIQTIPGLALLAFMIPWLGIGTTPAFVALFVYALLPIARATIAGLRIADSDAAAAVQAMGATSRQALLWVRLPLAAPVVLSGIRTAAVLTIGTATLAAFIGGGGLGEPIVTGLGLADMRLVLSGALPAALLAVVVDVVLALAERMVAPAHTRGRRPDQTGR
ncbi:MAG: glycine betaine ABC transporter substrate-binding protein [Gemmatimonadaceae bacterium]|nr:glycine betaine ABC transporter substrate-binding protein [Gemmatimonadaceae bacterium]